MKQAGRRLIALMVLVSVITMFLPAEIRIFAAQKFARLSSESVEVAVGGTFDLRDLLTNKNGKIKFTNDNKSAANVSKKGLVTGLAEGTANVTVKQTIKKKAKTLGRVTVTVTAAKEVDQAVIDGNLQLSNVRLAYHEGSYKIEGQKDACWYEEWFEIDGPSDL